MWVFILLIKFSIVTSQCSTHSSSCASFSYDSSNNYHSRQCDTCKTGRGACKTITRYNGCEVSHYLFIVLFKN